MLHFDLVSILFGTSIPTSFNILVKMFLHFLIRDVMAEFGVQRGRDSGFYADKELSGIYTELWELDVNRLTLGKHYCINLQGGT